MDDAVIGNRVKVKESAREAHIFRRHEKMPAMDAAKAGGDIGKISHCGNVQPAIGHGNDQPRRAEAKLYPARHARGQGCGIVGAFLLKAAQRLVQHIHAGDARIQRACGQALGDFGCRHQRDGKPLKTRRTRCIAARLYLKAMPGALKECEAIILETPF